MVLRAIKQASFLLTNGNTQGVTQIGWQLKRYGAHFGITSSPFS